VSFRWPNEPDDQAIIQRYIQNPTERVRLESRLEGYHDLDEGDIVVYCPFYNENPDKMADILAEGAGGRVKRLGDFKELRALEEARIIAEAHQKTWRMLIFVDRARADQAGLLQRLYTDAVDFLGLSPDRELESNKPDTHPGHYVRRQLGRVALHPTESQISELVERDRGAPAGLKPSELIKMAREFTSRRP
jgi:hypothetical protein